MSGPSSEKLSAALPQQRNDGIGGSGPHVLTITAFYPCEPDDIGVCCVAESLAELIRAGTRSTVFAVQPFYSWHRKTSSAPGVSWCSYPSLPGEVGLAIGGLGLFWSVRNAVARIHRQCPIDVIHAHGVFPCGDAARSLGRHFDIPYIVTVHNLDTFSPAQLGGLATAWGERVSQRVFHGARQVIGSSQRSCAEIERRTGNRFRVMTIFNGVDTVRFAPGPESPVPTLLTVGHLTNTNGHELIVRALVSLRRQFPGLTWEVIGEGPELDRVRRLAQEVGVLGDIRFLGRRSREAIADAYRRCTVFVLPSRSEAVGCVYLEAMASGKVAVGCIGQGIAEVIQHGENGWLIPLGRQCELIEGLRALLGDHSRRVQIGTAARETILNGFTLQHQAQRLMSVYRECLSELACDNQRRG